VRAPIEPSYAPCAALKYLSLSLYMPSSSSIYSKALLTYNPPLDTILYYL
jgi:hypothetical protein